MLYTMMSIKVTFPSLVNENSISKFILMQPMKSFGPKGTESPQTLGVFICESLNLCIQMVIYVIDTCISITSS